MNMMGTHLIGKSLSNCTNEELRSSTSQSRGASDAHASRKECRSPDYLFRGIQSAGATVLCHMGRYGSTPADMQLFEDVMHVIFYGGRTYAEV